MDREISINPPNVVKPLKIDFCLAFEGTIMYTFLITVIFNVI